MAAYIVGVIGILFGLAEVLFVILYFVEGVRVSAGFETGLVVVTIVTYHTVHIDCAMIWGVHSRRSWPILLWLLSRLLVFYMVIGFIAYRIVSACVHGPDVATAVSIVGAIIFAIAQMYCIVVVDSARMDMESESDHEVRELTSTSR